MTKPLRLLQDPNTAAALRDALQAEVATSAAQDASVFKAALVEKLATGASATGAATGAGVASSGVGAAAAKVAGSAVATKLIGVSVAAVIAAGGIGYTLLQGDQPATDSTISPSVDPGPAPVPEPALVEPPPQEFPDDAAEVEPLQLDVWELDARELRQHVQSNNKPRAPRIAAPPAIEETPTAPASSSTLAAQLALYEEGRTALRAREATAAVERFDTYLERYPSGQLRSEAQLSLLQALVLGGQHARAQTLAGRLAADPVYARRRGELLRVRAESQVLLGQCAQARQSFDAARSAPGAGLDRATVEVALERCEASAGRGP